MKILENKNLVDSVNHPIIQTIIVKVSRKKRQNLPPVKKKRTCKFDDSPIFIVKYFNYLSEQKTKLFVFY